MEANWKDIWWAARRSGAEDYRWQRKGSIDLTAEAWELLRDRRSGMPYAKLGDKYNLSKVGAAAACTSAARRARILASIQISQLADLLYRLPPTLTKPHQREASASL